MPLASRPQYTTVCESRSPMLRRMGFSLTGWLGCIMDFHAAMKSVFCGGLFPAPLLLSAVLACAGEDTAPAVSRRDSAGISIVTSSSRDTTLGWTLLPVLQLGGKETGPEGFGDVWSGNVSADGKGRVFVVDGDRYRLYAFDTSGRFLFEAGNKGEGPGEMENPSRVIPLSDSVIGVYDADKDGFIRFGTGGEPLPQLKGAWGSASDVVPLDDSLFVHSAQGGDFFSSVESRMLLLGNGDRRDTLLTVEAKNFVLELKDCGISYGEAPVFSNAIVWSARHYWLAAAVTATYEIRLYNRGILSRILRRDIPPLKATKELAIQYAPPVRIRMTGGPLCGGMTSEQIVDKVGFEKVVPFIRAITLAPGGEVWVLRNSLAGEARALDIFGADGSYIGTVRGLLGIPTAFVTESLIAELKKDTATGLPFIALSRIRR